MRTHIFIGIFLLIAGVFLNAQNTAPSWLVDTELEYPRSRYVTAVGEGKSRADAEAAAVASLSLFFNTRADVRNEAIREFNEAVTGNTTEFSGKTYIRESAVISSEAEFLGVSFTPPYLIQARQTWTVLAYIDKAQASGAYESKISMNMNSINALAADASTETEPLYVCGLLFRAVKIAGLTEEYIKTAAAIDPARAGNYTAALEQIQQTRAAYRTSRDGLSFAVISGEEATAQRVSRKIQELLEDSGYTIGAENSTYTVTTRLDLPDEQMGANIFVRPGISVRVGREGKALFSYGKNYQRYGHRTLDGAYNRAFMAIERDLEENFTAKLAAMIGG